MRTISLGYHDVVDSGNVELDRRPAAGHYSLTRVNFRQHLQAVKAAGAVVSAVAKASTGNQPSVLFTFDDGAIGAYDCVADDLEGLGWRGHFFITTDWIATPGFMAPHHLRELHRRGHIIGSHTCSHPTRMSSLTSDQLSHEWSVSRIVLEQILGAPVDSASVADGYYSKRVGLTAQQAGIRYLFNSEPTDRVTTESGCRIFGRFPIFASSAPALAAAYASGALIPRLRQSAAWKVKKLVKSLGGETYLAVRRSVLSRSPSR